MTFPEIFGYQNFLHPVFILASHQRCSLPVIRVGIIVILELYLSLSLLVFPFSVPDFWWDRGEKVLRRLAI